MDKSAENICADAGYSSVEDLKPLLDAGKTLVVPNKEQAKKQAKDEPFGKNAFRYDKQTDTYTCPAGQLLHNRYHDSDRNRYEYRTKLLVFHVYTLVSVQTQRSAEVLYDLPTKKSLSLWPELMKVKKVNEFMSDVK